MLGGGGGSRCATAIAFGLLVALSATAPARGAEPVTKRSVLGSVISPQSLEISTEPGSWTRAAQGAAVLEESELRVSRGRPAVVGLGKEGVVSLREGSRVHVGSMGAEGLPLTLRGDAVLSFRLPSDTRLVLVTDAAVVSAGGADGTDTSVQGIVSQQGGVTVVSVVAGSMHARRHGSDEIVQVARGEEATIRTREGDAEVTRMTRESEQRTRKRLIGLGFQRSGLIIAGATVAAVGGGIGIAAAAGAFDSSSGSNNSHQGSPFEP